MEIELRNVGIIRSAHLQFVQGLNLIVGASSSGKSTLLRAIRSMMDNSFSDSSISYGQRKMAIRIQYNDHSATYIRDLDNSSRKTAYQIDGKVYTKLGRTSLEDLSNLFKLAPVEIDGEKINFNFSAQFSGPFLLLGSASLLYSILTYRSSFDITKINDLYFSDFKSTKKELDATIKTKKTLEKEKDKKEDELKRLSSIPDLYKNILILKGRNEEHTRIFNTYLLYKEGIQLIEKKKEILEKLNILLSKYKTYNILYNEFFALREYKNSKKELRKIERNIKKDSKILQQLDCLFNTYTYTTLLQCYYDTQNKFLLSKNKVDYFSKKTDKLSSFISEYNQLLLLISYNDSVIKKNQSIKDIQKIKHTQSCISSFVSEYPKIILLVNYKRTYDALMPLRHSISLQRDICKDIENIKRNYLLYSVLFNYVKVKNKVDHNQNILRNILISDTKNLLYIRQYLEKKEEYNKIKKGICDIDNTLGSVLKSIKDVGICPLCKQPLCDC